jgi:hypothetical protein
MRSGCVGVVVLDQGRPDDTAEAVTSALDARLEPRVVVVENGPGPAPALPPGVEMIRLSENRGYAAGMNAGVARLRSAGCDRFLLLNNDAVLEPGCLRRLAEGLEDPGLAALGPVVLRREDGRVESRGARFDPQWGRQRLSGHGEWPERREGIADVEVVSGAVWMLSRAAFERVGPLEESYFFSFEEVDWCLRARGAGLRVGVALDARARHWGSRTLGQDSPTRLYYAARNHLHTAERHRPLAGPARWLRRGVIVALNLAHALTQRQVARAAGCRAVLRGTADFWKGRLGPAGEAP